MTQTSVLTDAHTAEVHHPDPLRQLCPSELERGRSGAMRNGFEADGVGRLPLSAEQVEEQTSLLCYSYQLAYGEPIVDSPAIRALDAEGKGDLRAAAKELFRAPHVVLSHDVRDEPEGGGRRNVFNYANVAAARVFGRDLQDLVGLDSTGSAEKQERAARGRLLGDCVVHGKRTYSAVRLNGAGERFRIVSGILFNVVDLYGVYRGQATLIDLDQIEMVDETEGEPEEP